MGMFSTNFNDDKKTNKILKVSTKSFAKGPGNVVDICFWLDHSRNKGLEVIHEIGFSASCSSHS